MIWMVVGAGLLIILLGAPALVDPIRKATARREAAAAARAADEAQRKRDALAAQQQAELLWNNSPDRAGLREYLRYIAQVKMRLEHAVDERQRRHDQRVEQVQHHLSGYRDNKLPSAAYRLLVLIGLIFFLAVFVLGIALDYLIFRGLHPSGTMILPLGLACLAVLGITVGSIMMLGAARHQLLHSATPYFQRVVMVGGAILAVGVATYMAVIAPNRSYPAGEAKIAAAEQTLQADQSAQPPVGQQVITLDQTAVTQAKANLAHAQQVDRLSAAALAFIEIPLSEAAVLGGELAMLYTAIFRRERARQAQQQAASALQQANARFMAQLTQVLVDHGHDEEAVRRILTRFARMNTPVSGQLTSGAVPTPANPGGPAPGGGGTPGGTPGGPAGNPAGNPAGGGTAGFAPSGPPGWPTQGHPGVPAPGGTPVTPAINVIPPAGPVTGAGPVTAPTGTAPIVGLPAAEFDETE
jgi:type II secretory pathway pseudopilin PulG